MKIDDSIRRERPKLKSDDRHTVFDSPKKKMKNATPPTFLAYRPAARRGPRSEKACKTYIKMHKRLKMTTGITLERRPSRNDRQAYIRSDSDIKKLVFY